MLVYGGRCTVCFRSCSLSLPYLVTAMSTLPLHYIPGILLACKTQNTMSLHCPSPSCKLCCHLRQISLVLCVNHIHGQQTDIDSWFSEGMPGWRIRIVLTRLLSNIGHPDRNYNCNFISFNGSHSRIFKYLNNVWPMSTWMYNYVYHNVYFLLEILQ